MNNINFNDLPCDIKYLIFNENRQEAYKLNKKNKNKYNEIINQLNIVNNLYGEGAFNPNNNFWFKICCINESKKQLSKTL